MKFMIAFAALVVVAHAQYLRDSDAVVQGAKAVLEGPSGTLAVDTGAVVKSGLARGIVAPSAAAFINPGLIDSRIIGSPLLSRSILDARGLYDPRLTNRGLYNPLLDNRGLYNPLLDNRGLYNPLLDSGILGARSFYL